MNLSPKERKEYAAMLGKANVKKNGVEHMQKISKDYWDSPKGLKRRKLISKENGKETNN